jgi:hypothetical protein
MATKTAQRLYAAVSEPVQIEDILAVDDFMVVDQYRHTLDDEDDEYRYIERALTNRHTHLPVPLTILMPAINMSIPASASDTAQPSWPRSRR